MDIQDIYADALGLAFSAVGLFGLFTLTWIISIPMKNLGIIDIVWGMSFVIQALITYFYYAAKLSVTIWQVALFSGLIIFHGLRLSIFLAVRNCGHPEDRRYKILFREKYGEKIGVDLLNNGDLAMDPINSYKIASVYMRGRTFIYVTNPSAKFTTKHGSWTGLEAARRSVNGGTKEMDKINNAYNAWVTVLKESKAGAV